MWIEKAAKNEQQKLELFNKFLKELKLSEIYKYEKLENEYKVYYKEYCIYFSDFDVNMNGIMQIVSNFDYFSNLWGKTLSSMLNEEERVNYIKEFKNAEKPYVKHLQELDEFANNW